MHGSGHPLIAAGAGGSGHGAGGWRVPARSRDRSSTVATGLRRGCAPPVRVSCHAGLVPSCLGRRNQRSRVQSNPPCRKQSCPISRRPPRLETTRPGFVSAGWSVGKLLMTATVAAGRAHAADMGSCIPRRGLQPTAASGFDGFRRSGYTVGLGVGAPGFRWRRIRCPRARTSCECRLGAPCWVAAQVPGVVGGVHGCTLE